MCNIKWAILHYEYVYFKYFKYILMLKLLYFYLSKNIMQDFYLQLSIFTL